MKQEYRAPFTRYQFPEFGNQVSLLTLRQKIGEASVVDEHHIVDGVETEDFDTVYYGWWPNGKLPEGKPEQYIPEIGGSICLSAPDFWGRYMYEFTLTRMKHNTFVVTRCEG